MYPVILHLGPITIYSYGLMMAIAFLVGGWILTAELKRRDLDPEMASTMVFWAAIGGLVGSRILSILEDLPGFLADPIHGIFTGAGFTWYGGLIGGFLAVTMTIRKHSMPWAATVDCIAPVLALGHAIGRIGCELAGDGDWGTVTDLPWGRAYPNAIVGWPYPPGVYVHPTPIYETIAYSIIFAILWSLRKRPHRDSTLLWLYFILGSSARFVIEFARINPRYALGLSLSQWISIALISIGAWQLASHRETAKPLRAAEQ